MNLLRSTCHGLICGFLVFLLCSCGTGSSTPPPPNNPAPSIQSISPNSAAAGSNGFTLTITGSNFLSSSTVTWNGNSRKATFVSSSQLTIAVSASDLGASGTIAVAVTNPTPGGGQATANFTINSPGVPAVTSVSPNTLGVGTSAIALTVTGSGFVMNSVVQWNGSARPTTYVSNTQLTVSIPASDLTNPISSLPITVMTPSPGGGTSNTVPVAVVSPALPTITSLSPSQVVLGGPAFTLTVNGTNFVGGANVYWNGISRVTQFVSSTQLTASILASDIALPAASNSASITVENPTPNAGISAPATVTLQNPAPAITSLSPASGVAGTPVAVTITGSQFVSGATVQFGGQVFSTTFGSTSSISVVLNATVGTTSLTVSNPSPSAGPSNVLTFTGTAAGQGVQQTVGSVDPNGKTIALNGTGMIDASGRYFAFFDLNDNLYLRDTCLGAPSGCTPASSLSGNFSRSSQGYDTFNAIWVSSDGQYVSFLEGLTTTDQLMQQVDIVGTCLGSSSCTPGAIVTTLANTRGAFLAQDGRYLSYATGQSLVNPPTGAGIYDTCYGAPAGCTQMTLTPAVSTTNNSVPVSSADGRYLVYQNTSSQIVLHDSCLGAAPGCSPLDNVVSTGSVPCQAPTISPDAQYLAYSCTPSGNMTGTGYLQAISPCLGSTSGCSTGPTTFSTSVQSSTALWLSDAGTFVGFQGSLNGLAEIYLYDSCNGVSTGCTTQTVPVSVNSSGAAANANCSLVGMSSNGQYVLFQSPATNLATLPSGLPSGFSVAYIATSPSF
ncbi:MAG TPA: IPT/TIG domain-containing protein [Candidatus Sulfotelmatobacter sp.]|nr:IPT/TIG domain-containing protein [Candidatus Sulfotelmatobacter sp.]